MKCAIAECPNKQGDGRFVGEFCGPCYDALKGTRSPAAAKRIIVSLVKRAL